MYNHDVLKAHQFNIHAGYYMEDDKYKFFFSSSSHNKDQIITLFDTYMEMDLAYRELYLKAIEK